MLLWVDGKKEKENKNLIMYRFELFIESYIQTKEMFIQNRVKSYQKEREKNLKNITDNFFSSFFFFYFISSFFFFFSFLFFFIDFLYRLFVVGGWNSSTQFQDIHILDTQPTGRVISEMTQRIVDNMEMGDEDEEYIIEDTDWIWSMFKIEKLKCSNCITIIVVIIVIVIFY